MSAFAGKVDRPRQAPVAIRAYIRSMCGRFTNRLTWREIVALYRLSVPAEPERNLPARYNICPTDPIDAVVERDGRRDLVPMRWGLVPSWWKRPLKDFKIATFNARAETIKSKAMFRNPFRQKRCLIPASGYYEWESTPTGKQPYYFSTENGSPLTIAGLWDEWKDIETGVPLRSCTMIITTANDFVGKIHDRMPALLTPYQFNSWLSGGAGPELLRPWDQKSLQMYPVLRRVNSSKAAGDDPTLIERIEV